MKLFHVSTFRSTRAVWMWFELKILYGSRIPECEIIWLNPETFRHQKPAILLEANPNGKVPTLALNNGCMFESCGICLYFLENFDLDNLLSPLDDNFRQNLYTMSFYASGTLDNLTATSSPIQRVLSNPKPGNSQELIDANFEYWKKYSGNILSDLLSDKEYMNGKDFSALDVVLGYNMQAVYDKRQWKVPEFDNLQQYWNRLKIRPSYLKALGTNNLSKL